MVKIICVGFGGALGAVLRYLISLIPLKSTFPILTLFTNLSGAILIGIIVGLVINDSDISDNQILFWKTGVCGGFTTFSTFSLEALQLLEKGKIVTGSIYIILSVILCITGVYLGRYISRYVLVK
jgi:CrcB protein